MQWQVRILHFMQECFYDDQDFARVMTSTREISRFSDGSTTEARTHFRRVRKQKPRTLGKNKSKVAKVGAEDWGRARNPGPREDFGSVNYQIHQTAVFIAPSTNESDSGRLRLWSLH